MHLCKKYLERVGKRFALVGDHRGTVVRAEGWAPGEVASNPGSDTSLLYGYFHSCEVGIVTLTMPDSSGFEIFPGQALYAGAKLYHSAQSWKSYISLFLKRKEKLSHTV